MHASATGYLYTSPHSILRYVNTEFERDKREAHAHFMHDVWLVARIAYRRPDRECARVAAILEHALAERANAAWAHLYEHVTRLVDAYELHCRGNRATDDEQHAAESLRHFLTENRDLATSHHNVA